MKKVFLGMFTVFLITLNCCAGTPKKQTKYSYKNFNFKLELSNLGSLVATD